MINNKKILIVGAGGFIGGHLVKRLLKNNNSIVAVDIKPSYWFQDYDNVKNHYSMDMKEIDNRVTKILTMFLTWPATWGGMGFIENNKAEWQSVLINTNLLIACKENKIQRYFFSSSACAYNKNKQQDVFIDGLKEIDAYPADPEDTDGKLFSERMCRHFMKIMELKLELPDITIYMVLRNIRGREKALQLYVEKLFTQKNNENEIEVWVDGKQTRSFFVYR